MHKLLERQQRERHIPLEREVLELHSLPLRRGDSQREGEGGETGGETSIDWSREE
jgi:hypothetical protein